MKLGGLMHNIILRQNPKYYVCAHKNVVLRWNKPICDSWKCRKSAFYDITEKLINEIVQNLQRRSVWPLWVYPENFVPIRWNVFEKWANLWFSTKSHPENMWFTKKFVRRLYIKKYLADLNEIYRAFAYHQVTFKSQILCLFSV